MSRYNDGLFVCWRLSNGSCTSFLNQQKLKFEILFKGKLSTNRGSFIANVSLQRDSDYQDFMKAIPPPLISTGHVFCSESITFCSHITAVNIVRQDPYERRYDNSFRFIPYRPYVLHIYEIQPPKRELKLFLNVSFISSDGIPDAPMNQKLQPTRDFCAMYL